MTTSDPGLTLVLVIGTLCLATIVGVFFYLRQKPSFLEHVAQLLPSNAYEGHMCMLDDEVYVFHNGRWQRAEHVPEQGDVQAVMKDVSDLTGVPENLENSGGAGERLSESTHVPTKSYAMVDARKAKARLEAGIFRRCSPEEATHLSSIDGQDVFMRLD